MVIRKISDFLDFILNQRGKLHPVENMFLLGLAAELNTPSNEKMVLQIKAINQVKRDVSGKNVLLYCRQNGKYAFPPNVIFHCGKSNFHLATVRLINLKNGNALTVDVWVVDGHIFEIVYNKPLGKTFLSAEMTKSEIIVDLYKIHQNPAENHLGKSALDSETENGVDRLSSIFVGKRISEIQPAAQLGEIIAAERSQRVKFPKEYVKVLRISNGVKIGEWEIFSLQKIRTLTTSGENFSLVGERIGFGCLGCKIDSFLGEIYWINYVDETISKVGFINEINAQGSGL